MTDNRDMKYLKQHPVKATALLGLFLSLGAPVGFITVTYYFQNGEALGPSEHLLRLQREQWETLLYIGIGTSTFFTIFGALCGHLLRRLLEEQEAREQLHRSKQELIHYFLTRIRKATTIGLEGLYHLKHGVLRPAEREMVLAATIKELVLIDDSSREMQLLRRDPKTRKTCSVQEVIHLMSSSSLRHDLVIKEAVVGVDVSGHLMADPRFLKLTFDLIFEWTNIHELGPLTLDLSQRDGALLLDLRFSVNGHVSEMSLPVVKELAEGAGGICVLRSDSIRLAFSLKAKAHNGRAA